MSGRADYRPEATAAGNPCQLGEISCATAAPFAPWAPASRGGSPPYLARSASAMLASCSSVISSRGWVNSTSLGKRATIALTIASGLVASVSARALSPCSSAGTSRCTYYGSPLDVPWDCRSELEKQATSAHLAAQNGAMLHLGEAVAQAAVAASAPRVTELERDERGNAVRSVSRRADDE